MELKWDVIRFENLNKFMLVNQFSKIKYFSLKNQTFLIHAQGKLVSILLLKQPPLQSTLIQTIEIDGEINNLMLISDNLMITDASGNIYKMTFDNDIMYSKLQTIKIYKLFMELPQGFVAIRQDEEYSLIDVYEKKDNKFLLQLSTMCSGDIQFLACLSASEIGFNILKYFFQDISLTCQQVVLFSLTSGAIFLYPVFNKLQNVSPIAIHFSLGKTIFARAVKKSIIILFACGKLLILHWDDGLKVTEHFLTDIFCANVLETPDAFHIIWSNGIGLCLATIRNFTEFIMGNVKKPIRGTSQLLNFKDNSLLAVTFNNCFYEIIIEPSQETITLDATSSDLLSAISDARMEIEKSEQEIESLKEQIVAISLEELNPSSFNMKLEGNILKIHNASLKLISMDIWRLKVEFEKNLHRSTIIFDLESNLQSKMSADFILPAQELNNSKQIYISFIGLISNNYKSLSIPLGQFDVQYSDSLNKKLSHIFNTRNLN